MARAAKRAATYDDLLKVPDHFIAEIVDGELFTNPRPALRHATASSALGALLGSAFMFGHGGPGGWWILFEPELGRSHGSRGLTTTFRCSGLST